ncbi:MAG: hypothetical protein DMG21_00020 [Acidobacteria bacterium]|nr:MAG: hypothetical protein DMG21_00020 [Acidobacteriota bacterium]
MTLLDAIKGQRAGLTAAITVAILLIFVFHAPVLPVVAGCFICLTYFILRSWSKDSSGKTNR